MIHKILSWIVVVIVVLAFSVGATAAVTFATDAGSVGSTVVVAAAKGVSAFVGGVSKGGVLTPPPAGGTPSPTPSTTPPAVAKPAPAAKPA